MPNNFLIRPARTDDFDDLVRLFEEVAEERLWIGTEPGFDQNAYRLGWKRIVEESIGALLVATRDNELIGALSTFANSEHGCEIGMLVKPGRRGTGVGTALLNDAIEWARRQTKAVVSLCVFAHNVTAIRLYKRCGFVEKQYCKSFKQRQNGEEWDVLLMELRLETETHKHSDQ